MGIPTRTLWVVASLMMFGTLSAVLSKIIYQVDGPDLHDHLKPFRKPWAATLFMFIGMACTLPVTLALEAWKRKRTNMATSNLGSQHANSMLQQPLLRDNVAMATQGNERSMHSRNSATSGFSATSASSKHSSGSKPRSTWSAVREVLLIGIPTLCDLVATVLMSVGLLYVTASVYQMMRGAEMLFSALLSLLCLKRTLNPKHLSGLLLSMAGISLVGYASSRNPDAQPDSPSNMHPLWGRVLLLLQQEPSPDAQLAVLGMTLIILAQAVQASQVVLEDHFMRTVGMSPLRIVGVEGVLGTMVIMGLILPLAQIAGGPEGNGVHEDSLETWHVRQPSEMLTHSGPLLAISLITIANLALYNIAGMFVTDELGAVSRTVLETLRTLFVWLTDLALFYSPLGQQHHLGEAWTTSSWVQAAGFAVLVAGTLVYSWGDADVLHEAKSVAVQNGLPPEVADKLAAWRLRRNAQPKANATLRIPTPSAVLAYRIHLLMEEARNRHTTDAHRDFASVVRHVIRRQRADRQCPGWEHRSWESGEHLLAQTL